MGPRSTLLLALSGAALIAAGCGSSVTTDLPSLPFQGPGATQVPVTLLAASGQGSRSLGEIVPPRGTLVFEVTCDGPGGALVRSVPRARFGFFTDGPCAREIKTSAFRNYRGGRFRVEIAAADTTRWKIYVGMGSPAP